MLAHLSGATVLAAASDAPEPALSTTPLLLIALASVLLLLLLIIKLKLHAFVALILISLLTALATGIPTGDIVDTMLDGFGGTLASVAVLVGLGAMLGALLDESGGAQVLADTLLHRFGEQRAPLALGVACLFFGFPIFFDAGFVVFLPIVFTVARRLGGSLLTYALPVAGAFAMMHAFVPPHPGPVAAADLVGADLGLVLIFGLLIGVPTWFVGSYLFSQYIGPKIHVPVPDTMGSDGSGGDPEPRDPGGSASRADESGGSTAAEGTTQTVTQDRPREDAGPGAPSFGVVVGVLLLPMILIFLNTGLTTLASSGVLAEDSAVVAVGTTIGATPVALLISVLVGIWVLGLRRGTSRSDVESLLNGSLPAVCAVILITGAGGMFGGILQASGIGSALSDTLESTGLPVIVAAFLIALALRVAQGSATVALTTSAALISPTIEASTGLSAVDLALIVIAIASGSTMLSHVNDSGFWLVGRFLGMDEETTLKTWTVMVTLIGGIGATLSILLSLVL